MANLPSIVTIQGPQVPAFHSDVQNKDICKRSHPPSDLPDAAQGVKLFRSCRPGPRITRQGQKGHAVTCGTLCLPADSHSGWGGPTTPFPQAQSDTHPSLGTAAPRSPRPATPPRLGTAVSCLPWRGCQVSPRSLHSRTNQCSEDDIRLPQQRHRAEAWPRKNPI